MKAGAIAVLLFGLAALYFGLYTPNQTWEIKEAKIHVVAINYGVFRNAVHMYVHHNQAELLNKDTELGFDKFAAWVPSGWQPMREWKARIINNTCYVYGEAEPDDIEAVRVLFRGSFAVGRNDHGRLVPDHKGTMPVPDFVPQDALVSITELRP